MDFEGIGLFGMFAVIAIAAICAGTVTEVVKTLHEPVCECAAEVPP